MYRKVLVVILASGTLAGCGTLSRMAKNNLKEAYRDYTVSDLKPGAGAAYARLVEQLTEPPKAENKPAEETAQPTQDHQAQAKQTEQIKHALIDAKCFAAMIDDATVKASCAKQRNIAVSALIIDSEALCVEHRRTIYGNDAAWNITTGTFTNLFSGAASVFTPTTTKSALSALALLSNSERSLVNETVYKSMLVHAVDGKIVQSRQAKALDIHRKFSRTIDEYPPAEAIQDVLDFHYSCSFMDGLRLALEEGAQNPARQKKLELEATARQLTLELSTIPATAAPEVRGPLVEALKKRFEAVMQELGKYDTQSSGNPEPRPDKQDTQSPGNAESSPDKAAPPTPAQPAQ